MAPRRKGKGGKRKARKVDYESEKKQVKVEVLINELDQFIRSRIDDINAETESVCEEITKDFELALKNIPQKYHSMTFDQINSLSKKTPLRLESPKMCLASSSSTGSYSSSTFMSKLKNMHIQRTGSSNMKKRLISVTANASGKGNNTSVLLKSGVGNAHNNSSNSLAPKLYGLTQDQAGGSSYRKLYTTPHVKKTFGPQMKRHMKNSAMPVTPKFDPRTPLPTTMLRRPKAGETIMSMSGSPLQNTAAASNVQLTNSGIVLTLDNGKVLNLADNIDLPNSLDLDQKTKNTIMNIQKKLAGLLHL